MTSIIASCSAGKSRRRSHSILLLRHHLLNEGLMDSLGITTMEELVRWSREQGRIERERRFKQGSLSEKDLRYYVYDSPTLGWENIDEFAKMDPQRLANLALTLEFSPMIGCKLAFLDRRIVLPPVMVGTHYEFQGVPKGEKATIVAMKYEEGRAYLCLKPVEIARGPFSIEFTEYDLESFKAKLAELDR